MNAIYNRKCNIWFNIYVYLGVNIHAIVKVEMQIFKRYDYWNIKYFDRMISIISIYSSLPNKLNMCQPQLISWQFIAFKRLCFTYRCVQLKGL